MKSLAGYSSQKDNEARSTPELKQDIGKGWYLCLLDHCADNVSGNRLLFEHETHGHFTVSHKNLVPEDRVTNISVKVIQKYGAEGHLNPISKK